MLHARCVCSYARLSSQRRRCRCQLMRYWGRSVQTRRPGLLLCCQPRSRDFFFCVALCVLALVLRSVCVCRRVCISGVLDCVCVLLRAGLLQLCVHVACDLALLRSCSAPSLAPRVVLFVCRLRSSVVQASVISLPCARTCFCLARCSRALAFCVLLRSWRRRVAVSASVVYWTAFALCCVPACFSSVCMWRATWLCCVRAPRLRLHRVWCSVCAGCVLLSCRRP